VVLARGVVVEVVIVVAGVVVMRMHVSTTSVSMICVKAWKSVTVYTV
jgi:hypothetical protein